MDEGPAVAPAELWRGKWKVRRAPGSQQDKAQITNPLHASNASGILHLVHRTFYFVLIE